MNITIFNEYHPNEQSGKAAKTYPGGIHTTLAELFGQLPDVQVRTATQEEPVHGLTDEVLDSTDVLVWWSKDWNNELLESVADKVASQLFFRENFEFSAAEPNKLYLGTVRAGRVEDKAFAVIFRAPKSYTGEDVVELQLHGGRVVAEAVLEAAVSFGARPAEPGEFTKRAYLNGKMSLSEAEGVEAIILADSTARAIFSAVIESGTTRKGSCQVTRLNKKCSPANAITGFPPHLSAKNSVCPAKLNPTFFISGEG